MSNINMSDINYNFFNAVQRNDIEQAKYHLNQGADINYVTKLRFDTYNALLLSFSSKNEEMAKFLIANGASCNPVVNGFEEFSMIRDIIKPHPQLNNILQECILERSVDNCKKLVCDNYTSEDFCKVAGDIPEIL
jgi:ankyrin repeat protein